MSLRALVCAVLLTFGAGMAGGTASASMNSPALISGPILTATGEFRIAARPPRKPRKPRKPRRPAVP